MLTLEAKQWRFIRTEMAINAGMSAVLPATAMWLFFSPFPLPLWGDNGFAAFLVKNTIGMSVVMTILMTIVIRFRVRRGSIPFILSSQLERSWIRFIPRWLLLRAALYAGMMVSVFLPLGVAIAISLAFDPMERTAFIAFNIVYGGMVGFLLTPLILIKAMSDGPSIGSVPIERQQPAKSQ